MHGFESRYPLCTCADYLLFFYIYVHLLCSNRLLFDYLLLEFDEQLVTFHSLLQKHFDALIDLNAHFLPQEAVMLLFDLLLLLFDSLFCLECFHCELQLVHNCLYGEMAERPIASDCKSDDSRLRRFESYSPQILIPISWALSSFGYPLKRTRSACLGEKRYPPLAYSNLTKHNAHIWALSSFG